MNGLLLEPVMGLCKIHFPIINSMEFQMNNMARRIRKIEKMMKEIQNKNTK